MLSIGFWPGEAAIIWNLEIFTLAHHECYARAAIAVRFSQPGEQGIVCLEIFVANGATVTYNHKILAVARIVLVQDFTLAECFLRATLL